MNAKLAQAIALVAFGNAFLRDVSLRVAPELIRYHSTFKNVQEVRFVRYKRRWRACGRVFAVHDPGQWLAILKEANAREIKLGSRSQLPQPFSENLDHILALEVRMEEHLELWVPSWKLRRWRRSNDKIWAVTYKGFRQSESTVPALQIGQTTMELKEALHQIRRFTLDHKLFTWGDQFRAALALLSDTNPTIPYFPDLLPNIPSVDLAVRRLLAAAVQGWVFGGMGTWNDIVFNEKSVVLDYRSVTGRLYAAVCRAIYAAVNIA